LPEIREEKIGSATCKALYIHIPFCGSKCPYCDFNSYALEEIPEERYVDCIIRELEYYLEKGFFSATLESVYLGGGTPSLLSMASMARIMEHIRGVFSGIDGAEITIEANPASVDKAKLKGYILSGINRLSLGVQSFSDSDLKALGRTHCAREAFGSFYLAREAGFTNIGIDLIYGVPGQSVDSFGLNLEKAVELAPEHISLYGLTCEEGTPFFAALRAGLLARVAEESERDMYLAAVERLKEAGYIHYEVSNFALPGRASRHNSAYWQRLGYIGLGAGAHSCSFGAEDGGARTGTERWWNDLDIEGYMRSVELLGFARADGETLTNEDERLEAVYLGLRVLGGVDIGAFRARYGSNPMELLSREAREEDFLTIDGSGLLRLTQKGLLFSDSLF